MEIRNFYQSYLFRSLWRKSGGHQNIKVIKVFFAAFSSIEVIATAVGNAYFSSVAKAIRMRVFINNTSFSRKAKIFFHEISVII